MDRRSFLRGLIAAPAVVSFSSLMPVRGIIMPRYSVEEIVAAAVQEAGTYGRSMMMYNLDLQWAINDMARILAVPPQWMRN